MPATIFRYLSIATLAVSTLAFAQNPPDNAQIPPPPSNAPDVQPPALSSGGWKRVGDAGAQGQANPGYAANQAQSGQPNDQGQQPQPPPPIQQPGPPNQQPYGNQQGYPNQPAYGNQQGYPQQPVYQQQPPVPASLSVPAGTYITVRVNQLLSSDKNQVGDAFSASLVQPLVVNGVVIAEPGQTIGGRVTEAVKAGHVTGVARLGIQLTDLALVDGQQIPIRSSLISRKGPTSVGQDTGTIAGTTALGAAVGAAADWGRGAAIGAGAGAAAGIIGVLVTRGHPSVIYPEQILTFRLEAPITMSTEHSPQAFRYVEPGEYDRPAYNQPAGGGNYGYAPGPYASVAPPPAYYGAYPYPYYGYGYGYGYPYWGPSFSLFFGRGYWGGYRGGFGYNRGGRGYYGGGYVHSYGGAVHGGFSGHSSGGGGHR